MIICGWFTGNSLYSVYADRMRLLDRFKAFLLFCESEITYEKTELATIIERFRQDSNPYDSYIFDRDYNGIHVSKPIRTCINTFLDKISILDSETQKKFFFEVKNTVSVLETSGNKQINSQGKMLKKLLPVIAIGIFILTL